MCPRRLHGHGGDAAPQARRTTCRCIGVAPLDDSSLRLRPGSLTCPLCHGDVAPASSGCLPCHLPLRDVLRHQRTGSAVDRALRVRLTGLVLYSGAVAWCAYQLPDSLPLVVPGAVLGGGVLHVWRGRPWLGLMVFAIIVVAVPVLLWPSMLTGTYVDLRDGW